MIHPRVLLRYTVDSGGDREDWIHPDEDVPDGYVRVPLIGDLAYCYEDETVWVRDESPRVRHPEDDVEMWCGDYYTCSYIEEEIFVCDCCGDRHHNDDYGSNGYCVNCDEDEDRDSRIRDYGCRSANRYAPEKDVPLKFGIEFEVESQNRSRLLDILDSKLPSQYVVYKEDGSLSYERGVEIVTRPDCPSVHKRVWASAFPHFQNYLECSSGCGIHIHVSRAKLGVLQIGKLLVFLNASDNATLVGKVAGRYDESYCSVRPKTLGSSRTCNNGRHDILNVTGDRTIEFRMFSSKRSQTAELFIKNIEFVEALMAFTAPGAAGVRDLTTEKFLTFVRARAKAYPHLVKFLKQ